MAETHSSVGAKHLRGCVSTRFPVPGLAHSGSRCGGRDPCADPWGRGGIAPPHPSHCVLAGVPGGLGKASICTSLNPLSRPSLSDGRSQNEGRWAALMLWGLGGEATGIPLAAVTRGNGWLWLPPGLSSQTHRITSAGEGGRN